jgi:hypothetical protein
MREGTIKFDPCSQYLTARRAAASSLTFVQFSFMTDFSNCGLFLWLTHRHEGQNPCLVSIPLSNVFINLR